MKLLLWTLALASAICVQANEWHAHYRMTSDEYQSTFDYYVDLGYRLNSVSGYERDGEANYAAIFEKKDSVAWRAHHGMTSESYQEKFDEYLDQGYRLIQVNGYTVDGATYFAAIWDKSPSGAWQARHGLTAECLQQYFDKYVADGYKLTHTSGYEVDGEVRFAAIWEKVTDGYAWWSWSGMTSTTYQQRFDDYLEEGFRVIDVSGYAVGNIVYYAAIWDQSPSGAWEARHGMDSATFQSEFNKYKADGYVLRTLNGYNTGTADQYAAIWIKP